MGAESRGTRETDVRAGPDRRVMTDALGRPQMSAWRKERGLSSNTCSGLEGHAPGAGPGVPAVRGRVWLGKQLHALLPGAHPGRITARGPGGQPNPHARKAHRSCRRRIGGDPQQEVQAEI